MQLCARVTVPFPREIVYRTYRDRLVELVPHLPDVRSIDEKERRVEGARTLLFNQWEANTEIPAVARRFVRPGMLRWDDHAEWDESAWTCRWRMELPALPGVLECAGLNRFHQVPAGTELEIGGVLILHLEHLRAGSLRLPSVLVPTIRPVVERLVMAALRPNLVSTGEGVKRFLRAQKTGA